MTGDVDHFAFWRNALEGNFAPVSDGDIQCGFYRSRNKDKTHDAVAVWYDSGDGSLRIHRNGRDWNEDRARASWNYFHRNPIRPEVYRSFIATGKWPGESEAVSADVAEEQRLVDRHHNISGEPDENSFEALKDRITDLARDAERLLKAGAATTQEQADEASNLANRIGELQKKADESRKTEKKPHDDAAKAVQNKWNPIIATADVYKTLKARRVTPFLLEEQRKANAAAAEAQRRVDEQRAAAIAEGRKPEPVAAPVAPKPVGAGASGRRTVALRTVKSAKIVDRAKVLAHFAESEKITEVLQTLADAAAKAGIPVPGVEITEEQSAA